MWDPVSTKIFIGSLRIITNEHMGMAYLPGVLKITPRLVHVSEQASGLTIICYGIVGIFVLNNFT